MPSSGADCIVFKMEIVRQLPKIHFSVLLHLLSGKLFCAKCGCTMKGISGHSGGNGEVYRYCACSNPQCRKRNIPKDDLEGKVIRSICDHLLQPETMELLAETMVEVQKADMEKPNAERDVLEQELRDVRRRSKNIILNHKHEKGTMQRNNTGPRSLRFCFRQAIRTLPSFSLCTPFPRRGKAPVFL